MNAAAPLVSVIIPCFNARPMLRSAVWSVIDQSYSNIEIIFVDNNSTDRSVDVASQIARACARSMRITKCAAQGANNARNWGHGFARGEFIQWMDADDRLDRDKIALQVAALERIPDDDIAYGDWTARHIEAGKPRSERRKSFSKSRTRCIARSLESGIHRTSICCVEGLPSGCRTCKPGGPNARSQPTSSIVRSPPC